jgi:muramoyltetrapeptide carboxypeptidase
LLFEKVSGRMSSSTTPRIKPHALRLGSTVGIVAPASNIKRADLEAGCEGLRRAGYRPIYSDTILDRDLYFAGSVERRARELEEMFVRDDVEAIICARGGYGANYLLEALALEKIKTHPKIFVGYSDVTTLLTYFFDKAGLVTFHGPMVAKDWLHQDGVDLASWQSALAGTAAWEPSLDADSGAKGLVDGAAEGILYGGCLSILVASLGTPYEIKTAGTILFLEDLAAKPFQIDRMLVQLKLAGKLDEVRGIVFGEMRDCMQNANQGYALEEVVLRVVGKLGVPVAYGVRSGHVTSRNITLPIGVRAGLTVNGAEVNLKILESAVTAGKNPPRS